MITIAVANQKGGVGKTTSVINLAAELAVRGYRTLAVDLDPQATLSMSAGATGLSPSETVASLLVPEVIPGDCRPLRAPWGGDLLPAPGELALSDSELLLLQSRRSDPNHRLHSALLRLEQSYDICLIDTPPQLGRLAANALCAANWALIPVSPDFFSVGGLALMLGTIDEVRQRENPSLAVLGIFATIVRRTMHANEWRLELERRFPEEWLSVGIPQTVSAQDAPQSGQALRDFEPHSRAANAYRLLCDQILQRMASAAEEQQAVGF